MSPKSAEVLAHALKLPADERAELADEVLASLLPEHDPKIEALWAEEAEQRIDAYERGELRAVPAEDVFRKIDAQKST